MIALANFDDDDLEKETVEQLRKRLAQALAVTAQGLTYMGRVWAALERKGEDLSALRVGIVAYVPLIAAGTVAPEAVVAFCGRPALLRKVSELPPAEQKRLAEGGAVKVVERDGAGFTHRMLPVASLLATPSLVRQVFGDRHLRSEAEQIAMLTEHPPAYEAGRPVKRGRVVVDRRKAVVKVGQASAPIEDVVAALKAAGVTW